MRAPVKPNDNGRFLKFLYGTVPGRILLKPLVSVGVSRFVGAFMNTVLSVPLIKPFIRSKGIDMSEYVPCKYHSFNEFFTRRIKPERRPVNNDENTLISPADGFLSAYRIEKGSVIPAKQSRYTIENLLNSAEDAKQFYGGVCLVFRLCADNYHRYCFIDAAEPIKRSFVKGKLHTVRAIALQNSPVFTENCREITLMKTEHFGTVAQIEVGAMLVGKIDNLPFDSRVCRGDEKGKFLYGGSTVILLLKNGAAEFDSELFEYTEKGFEFPVLQGEAVGSVLK